MNNYYVHDNEVIDLTAIEEIVHQMGSERNAIIPILQAIQEKYNYLPEAALNCVCKISDITPAAITGVATFYSQFRLRPAGRHTIKVCVGTACHVMGAAAIFDAFNDYLRIPAHDDTDDKRLFTVEKVACLGCCMLAPAVQIDDITYGFLNPEKVPQVLRDFLAAKNNGSTNSTEATTTSNDFAGVVNMCLCSSCKAAGTAKIFNEIQSQTHKLKLPIALKTVGCTGRAYQTPLIEIEMATGMRFQYGNVRLPDIRAILLTHFRAKSIAAKANVTLSGFLEKLLTDESWTPITRYAVDHRNGGHHSFVNAQHHLVTEHCGTLTPLSLEEYLKHDGFQALDYCLKYHAPQDIIDDIKISGLRGRGGAGFSTGNKWHIVAAQNDATKYIICNGDEGDPGAFMDRMILESFPFRVIEGIIIASYAIGAAEGYIYIRAEYPLAFQRMREAIAICQAHGLLGERIRGSAHSFQLHLVAGAGAFVCGEETALIAAIQGKRGTPQRRPPYPAQHGLYGKPTLVNNVETFAVVPWIIRNSADKFAALGTGQSKGTKTFALAGKIKRSGLIEVPMGITLRQIVDDIGGGVLHGGKLKAIQVGGPSGGCVPASLVDTPVDYDALVAAGAIMGSGGMVVLDETDCMVDIARYFMAFTQKESCGKCTFCRIGTKRMLEILERLCQGNGQHGDLERLEHLAISIQAGSLCGLGKTAPNPVLSTLKYFREEYEAHLNGRCPAGRCRTLITYSISDDCIGCTRCAQRCPVGAIEMKPYEKLMINTEKCTRCGTCKQSCRIGAVKVA